MGIAPGRLLIERPLLLDLRRCVPSSESEEEASLPMSVGSGRKARLSCARRACDEGDGRDSAETVVSLQWLRRAVKKLTCSRSLHDAADGGRFSALALSSSGPFDQDFVAGIAHSSLLLRRWIL